MTSAYHGVAFKIERSHAAQLCPKRLQDRNVIRSVTEKFRTVVLDWSVFRMDRDFIETRGSILVDVAVAGGVLQQGAIQVSRIEAAGLEVIGAGPILEKCHVGIVVARRINSHLNEVLRLDEFAGGIREFHVAG